jgi:hypothetical protein
MTQQERWELEQHIQGMTREDLERSQRALETTLVLVRFHLESPKPGPATDGLRWEN